MAVMSQHKSEVSFFLHLGTLDKQAIIRAVEAPAPTAASVNATSVAPVAATHLPL